MVCRVFQKSSEATKKPQQTESSQQSLESPCDTNSIVNEFGDIELPNINNIVNSSNGFNTFLTQSSCNNETNVNMNMNLHNWAATREQQPSLSWPSSLLSSNLTMNSLLLKALQMRNYHQREAAAAAAAAVAPSSSDHYSFLTQGSIISQFGADLSSNFHGCSSSSSSKVLETLPQPLQQEQPFNLDSIW